jgi:pantoate kinase
MSVMLGRGHCGAHLSLVFTIEDLDKEPLSQGSRGAGLCLEDGVEAIAIGEVGEGGLSVKFIHGDHDKTLYDEVLKTLEKEISMVGDFDWELNIKMKLPTSQGFGMSASGAVASAIAFQRAIGIPHEECIRRSFKIAHLVERSRSSGLGDTTALSSGGVERRLHPGSPYYGDLLDSGPGRSEGWSCETPVLLCWRKKTGRLTSSYIDEPEWKVSITDAGKIAMDTIGNGEWDQTRWQDLIEASRVFAKNSRLEYDANRSELLALVDDSISDAGLVGRVVGLLCMLGESVVVVPTDPKSAGEWIEALSHSLESTGLSVYSSKIGPKL